MITTEAFEKLQYQVDPKWNPWFLADDDTYRSRSVGARLSENTGIVNMYFETIRRLEPPYSNMSWMELLDNVGNMQSVVWDEHKHGKLFNQLCIENKVKRCMRDIYVNVGQTVENEKCEYVGKYVRNISTQKYTVRQVLQQVMYVLQCSVPLENLRIAMFKKPVGRKRKKTEFIYRSLDEKYYDDPRELDLGELYIELSIF